MEGVTKNFGVFSVHSVHCATKLWTWHHPTFIHCDTMQACDRRTDRNAIANTARSTATRCKTNDITVMFCSLTYMCFPVDVDVDVTTEASLHSRSSSLDSSTQQQQQRHSTPTPTPSDDSASARVSNPRDASSMDASKSAMWLGTEDGWYAISCCTCTCSRLLSYFIMCRAALYLWMNEWMNRLFKCARKN